MDRKQNYVSFVLKSKGSFFFLTSGSVFRSDVDPDNPQHEQYAASVVGSLIQELESKAQVLNTEEFFLTKIKLQGAAEMFRVSLLITHSCYFLDKLY